MSDPRESPLVRATWTINTCVDQIGTFLFACLIIATIKQKRLHNTCQILIGIYAFCSLLSKIQIILPYFVFMLPGSGKIPRLFCALIQIIPIGGCLNVFSLMLVIGIDRMLGIFCPIWYSTRSDRNYLKLLFFLSLSFPFIFLCFVIRSLIQDPFLQIQCFFPDLVGIDGQNFFDMTQLLLMFITLGCYILMLAKLIYDQKKGKGCSIRKSIYKTLALIMGIQIGGYISTLIVYNIFNQISSNFTAEQSQIIGCIINVASSLSSSIEVPAIFIVSTEHRLALKEEFKWFFNLFSKNNKNTAKVFTLTNKNTLTVNTKTITKTNNGIANVG
ncbi:unnamed protein product [Meloidogyne enterolobii]|uniref:Uncharacterized protein n=2 Tax=Meloidogyne enterolobii TaxID=390850 RepID=A0ACB0ZB63_MELEN